MTYGLYYVLFLVCFAILVILLADMARNNAERRDGYTRPGSKPSNNHPTTT